MEIIGFLLIGLVAGWLAGVLRKGRGFGLLGNLVVGVIGSLLGGFLFNFVGFSAQGKLATLIMATGGALVLLFLLGLVNLGGKR